MLSNQCKKAAAILCVACVASPAFAAVTFDAAAGTGFVGNGDVQSAFDWKKPDYQANARDVSFYYDSTATYRAVCSSPSVGTNSAQTITLRVHADVTSSVVIGGAKRIDGHLLGGYANVTRDGTLPALGASCTDTGAPADATWSSVERIEAAGALSARPKGEDHVILAGSEKVLAYW